MKGTLKYLAGIAGLSGYGSNSTAEQVTEDCACLIPPCLTAIITGATSGIGFETSRVLAKRGVRLVMPARNLKKANEAKEMIQNESPYADIIILEIDLSSLASVSRFCSDFLALRLPLNILM
uniref:Short-chain dehydrogenase TIC 32ic-like n=1 Tax=Rhizophora mucronata TaxID=61149 RepID=A0A2P2KH30_RHIMU